MHARPPADSLPLRLQQHKALLVQQEKQARQALNSYFQDLADCLQHAQAELLRDLDKQMLQFHEAAASTLKTVGKLGGSSEDDSLDNAMEIINCRVIHGSKVDQGQLKELLREVYFVKVGAHHEDSRVELPSLAESVASQQERMYSESAVEKIQCERDYYQKREEELVNKIREYQSGRKGANIRELSKSALEEKCSKWAIDRLREEKRVLIEKIGEASQQIMRQDALLSEHQEEIRKLSLLAQGNGRSIVGNSSIRNASLIADNQPNHQRESELEAKNAQLTLELTSHMQRLQEIYEANKQLEQQLERSKAELGNLQGQLGDLQQENALINNDYEASLRKKAVLEQQFNQLKKDHEDLLGKAEEEKTITQGLVEAVRLVEQQLKDKLKRTEAERQAEISSMQQKIADSLQQREKLVRKIEDISSKSGEQNNFKQLLSDQISRLLRQNAELQREVNNKEKLAFEAKEESARLELELKETLKKADSLKKENSQLKKGIKEADKQKNQLRSKLTFMENIQSKVQQLEQHFAHLQNEFCKNKEASERKNAQHERVMAVLKDRYSLQLSQLLAQETKKAKKEKPNRTDMIERYIQEMVAFSSKTAQIKQLKEQIRELKDKEGREIKKKQKTGLEESVSMIEWGIFSTNSKIFDERLKNQKEIFEERLNQMAELLKKEELAKSALAEQLQKERMSVAQLKNRQKQERIVDESAKNIKQLQQKMERLQEQNRKVRAKNKKLQSDLSDAQSQAKTKKELNLGLRNQLKAKEDQIMQLYKDIDGHKNEIDKLQRNTRQMGNKEELLRESKELYKKVQSEKEQLLQALEELAEKNKQLTRQLSKKDEVIKELSCIQGKQSKKKDDVLVRSLNNEITELKEANRRLKMDSDRKDEIIRNSKVKLQVKSKENQQVNLRMSKDCEKAAKDKEALERKLQSTASSLKKQQLKSSNLAWAIKKIFEMCSKVASKPEKQSAKGKPETTQYYTNSSISPHTLKMGTPASNLKSFISCEGLEILNLRPEDIEECLAGEPNSVNRTDLGESWCMASPVASKRREQQKREAVLQGLEQLQRILGAKQLSCSLLLQPFRQLLQK